MTAINKIKPLSDFLLIEPISEDTLLPSGIAVPDTAKEKKQEGKVLAVGTGRRDEKGNRVPMEIKVGDTVMYKKWGGTDLKAEGRDLILVKEEDLLAVIKE